MTIDVNESKRVDRLIDSMKYSYIPKKISKNMFHIQDTVVNQITKSPRNISKNLD